MFEDSSMEERVSRESRVIFELIEELKLAQALVILFYHHKRNLSYWCKVKTQLIKSSHSFRQLSIVAPLIKASSQGSLSESCILIPGLLSFLEQHQ